MGILGRIVSNSISTAVGVTASTYAVRGIDRGVANRQANRLPTEADLLAAITDAYVGRNMLPVDAQVAAQHALQHARQRLAQKGYTPVRPTVDEVLNGWTDYCRSLMAIECVRVDDLQRWWSTNGIMREVRAIWAEETYHEMLRSVMEAGFDQGTATRFAWKHVPVYGQPDLSGVHRDPDYTPLPLELMDRVDGYFRSNSHPFDAERADDAALESPTLNAFVRAQARAGRL
jgi:hypothetical protein